MTAQGNAKDKRLSEVAHHFSPKHGDEKAEVTTNESIQKGLLPICLPLQRQKTLNIKNSLVLRYRKQL